jgi:hypothetical protein
MIPVLHYFKFKFPGMFDDIEYDEEFYKTYMPRLNTLLKETFITDLYLYKVKVNVPAEEVKEPVKNEPEKKCDDRTKDKCDCHTESKDEHTIEEDYNTLYDLFKRYREGIERVAVSDEKQDNVLVLKEGECTFKGLDPRIKKIMKFHGTVKDPRETTTYIAQLKMKGTYKYTAINSIVVRELTECHTSFRLQTFNYMDTDGGDVLPYSEVRDTVYLTTKIAVPMNTPITGVCQTALKQFEQILIKHDRKDLIPYLSKITFKSSDIS